jgi:hypothetical protein
VASAFGVGFEDPINKDPGWDFTPGGAVQRVDKPNDPGYDAAEPPNTNTNLYDERFDLFGFPSTKTPEARYRDGHDVGKPMIAGYNAAGAWKRERGMESVSVAILDTGINWDTEGLRTQVRLNVGELPPPQPLNPSAGLGGYDLNGNGAVDVDDYKDDPRVGKPAPTGQDLIKAFSSGSFHGDADGNGYVDDIAGWDFFDDDNDPADTSSYFAAKNHGTGRAKEAVERANDGKDELGVCPHCQYVPLRIWDTFVSDQTTFALAVLYAADNGVSVIEGADGGLYHSAFMEQASRYAYEKGVVQVYSGDDLNTGNHNYPANYPHAMLIQGTAADTYGLGMDSDPNLGEFLNRIGQPLGTTVGTELPALTLFRGANTTQFGGKSSISMIGATGSENTGKASGAAALVISAAKRRGIALRPDETRTILEQTAEDVTPLNTLGLGNEDLAIVGWDPHFGWGRANVGEAVRAASDGKIPPRAAILSPDWYAPLTGDKVTITARAEAPYAASGFEWKLEWAPGQVPENGAFKEVCKGASSAAKDISCDIDLATVRAGNAAKTPQLDKGQPVFAPDKPTPYDHEWTVRLVVTTADQTVKPGIDRRVLGAIADPTLRPGYPKRLGTGGEAPLRYADLDGDNKPELVTPLEDGTVHAYKPDGSEAAGWPVKTQLLEQAKAHVSAPGVAALLPDAPPREPLRGPTIADLDADGLPEVISTAGRHIYAWTHDGRLRDGFPVSVDTGNCRPEDEKKDISHRKCGFLSTPAVAYIDGHDKPPVIIAPGLDQHVYGIRGDGSSAPGYPVELIDKAEAQPMRAEIINQPAIGDLNDDGRDDWVVATNETYGGTQPSGDDIAGLFAQGLSEILGQAAGGENRVYAVNGATGKVLPGAWPVKPPGAIQTTLPLVGPGHDPAIATIGGQKLIVISTTGSAGIQLHDTSGALVRTMNQQQPFGPASNAVDKSGQLNLFESAVVGDVLGTGATPAVVKYGLSLSAAANLLLVGQNFTYNHLMGAYDAQTGEDLPAYPTITDDFQFLSSSTVAKIDPGSPANSIVAGTGLGLLHAYDGVTAADAPGFPKVTGGWLFAPAAIADDGRMAAITREGYLFEWDTKAAKCQTEWPAYRHDQQGSGNYDTDGTPPGAVTGLSVTHKTGTTFTVRFTSPGDDAMCGTPVSYEARVGDTAVDLGGPVAAGQTVTKDVTLPSSGRLRVLAIDDAPNRGFPATADFAVPGPAAPGTSPGVTPGLSPTPFPKPLVKDTTPPALKVAVKRFTQSTGKVRLSLSASERTAYLVEVRRRPAKAFRRLTATADSTVVFRASGQGSTYDFRVTAYDAAGNRSKPTIVTAVVPVDQTRRTIRLDNGWVKTFRRFGTYGGTTARAKRAGASATLRFTGRRVWVLAPARARRSRLAITLDGRTYTARIVGRGGLVAPVFSRTLKPGRHTIRVRALDRRSALDAIAFER